MSLWRKRFIASVTEDPVNPEEVLLNLPDEFIDQEDWRPGDNIEWKLGEEGITMLNLSKKEREEMPIFIVEAVSMFRMRYAIRAKNAEHAGDTVVCQEAEDMSQKHLDEVIVSTRCVTEEEYLKMFDEDNDYLKGWESSKKLNAIHTINYEKDK